VLLRCARLEAEIAATALRGEVAHAVADLILVTRFFPRDASGSGGRWALAAAVAAGVFLCACSGVVLRISAIIRPPPAAGAGARVTAAIYAQGCGA
jgi:hypothetical protein